MTLYDIVYSFFNLILLLMFIRVLLTWFPQIRWQNQPFKSLKAATDVIFEPFRRIIPPVGMIDFSPIVAFFAISMIQRLCLMILVRYGF